MFHFTGRTKNFTLLQQCKRVQICVILSDPAFALFSKSKIMSACDLEKFYIYGIFAFGKVFGPTSKKEYSLQNILCELNMVLSPHFLSSLISLEPWSEENKT